MQSQLITQATPWYLPSLDPMKTDSVGQIVLNEADLINLIMQGRDLESISGALVDDSVDIEAAAFWLEQVPKMTYWSELDSQEVFDHAQQSTWHMPQEYQELDIAEHVLKMCDTEAQLQRCGAELLLYQERGLFDLLRYLKYLVDVMRDNHVIWGVGRGSSVASYVLYLLGVHRIDSMYYELDPAEFLR
jgi:DNA polymerase III alpha subunit